MREIPESKKTKNARIVFCPARGLKPSPAVRRYRAAWIYIAVAAALISPACHKKRKAHVAAAPSATATHPTIAPRIGASESGLASWYGYPYHGRRAANGEIYDMEKLTAAHRTLPFETWVEVRNLANEKTVKVRITDRGPFIEGRIIDLSYAAAKKLGDVQIGAFRDRDRAERLRAEYEQQFGSAIIVHRAGNPPVWRVLVGRERSLADAGGLLARIQEKNPGSAFVVRLDEPGSPAEATTPQE